jgi:hypothetical protein
MVKAVWKDSDVQKLRKQLVELQQELILSLNVMQRSDTSKRKLYYVILKFGSQSSSSILRGLGHTLKSIEEQKERSLRFYEVENQRSETLQKAERIIGSMDENGISTILTQCFDRLSAQMQTISKCQRVLNTLSFEEIYWRQGNITPAHARTFDWIFKTQELGFTKWAESQNGRHTIARQHPSWS